MKSTLHAKAGKRRWQTMTADERRAFIAHLNSRRKQMLQAGKKALDTAKASR